MSGILLTIGLKLWDTISEHCGDYVPNLALIRAANKAREAGLSEAARQYVIAKTDRFATGEWEFDFVRGELVKHSDARRDELVFDAALTPHDRLARANRRELDRKASNLLSVIKYASDEAIREEEAVTEALSSTPVQPDWFVRWKQEAENVGTEEMQRLWAAILLGEVKRPGTFALRTLDVVKNLTAGDAQTIQQAFKFVIADGILFRDLKCLYECDLPFAPLAMLEELGIVATIDIGGLGGREYMVGGSRKTGQFSMELSFRRSLSIHILGPDSEGKIKLPAIVLTRVGRDLLHVARPEDPPEQYIDRVAAHIKSQGYTARLFRRTNHANGATTQDVVREL